MDEQRRYLLTKYYDRMPDDETYQNMPTDHREQFASYVRMRDSLSEVHQLYLVYLASVYAISDNYVLNMDDSIIEKRTGQSADFIVLNMLFTNMISDGKTLVDAIDRFLNYDLGSSDNKKFDYIQKVYDNVFAYRFFYHMRNYCQHGHLAISRLSDQRFCFDMLQIRNVAHFSLREDVKKEWDMIIDEIAMKFGDEPHLMVTKHIDDYTKTVLDVYYEFLKFISYEVKEKDECVSIILKDNPNYICSEGVFSGLVLFSREDNNVDLFPYEAVNLDYYHQMRSDAKKNIKKYEINFHS